MLHGLSARHRHRSSGRRHYRDCRRVLADEAGAPAGRRNNAERGANHFAQSQRKAAGGARREMNSSGFQSGSTE